MRKIIVEMGMFLAGRSQHSLQGRWTAFEKGQHLGWATVRNKRQNPLTTMSM